MGKIGRVVRNSTHNLLTIVDKTSVIVCWQLSKLLELLTPTNCWQQEKPTLDSHACVLSTIQILCQNRFSNMFTKKKTVDRVLTAVNNLSTAVKTSSTAFTPANTPSTAFTVVNTAVKLRLQVSKLRKRCLRLSNFCKKYIYGKKTSFDCFDGGLVNTLEPSRRLTSWTQMLAK